MWAKYIVVIVLVVITSAQRRRPNILLLVTDDQDVMLGSMKVMNHARECITANGVEFSNAFTTTPICCPSRSSILTGLYSHNHHVYTNNDNCSSLLWQKFYESKSFATYLSGAGYHTGYFGKYLNEYNGTYTPPGWHYWMGLAKNSKYYNYTLWHNGRKEMHGDNYAEDYLTDLVTNRSIEFFRESKLQDRDQPVLTVVSFPAPHGPEDSAPQYTHLYKGADTHMTESFDYVPNPDKHWIIRQKLEKMDDDQLHFSTLLQQKRLQTLRSVDDNIKKIVDTLQEMQELDNTYIMYFSDHGYHIGQFGLPKGKSMPYDFDIRIPFLMRGPGLPKNQTLKKIALNIDIAPTILGMAGVTIPAEMDGRNLLDLFDAKSLADQPWRDSFLVQRGKMPRNKTQLVRPRMSTKLQRLQKLCASPNYANPCQPDQYWTCVTGSDEKLRLQKCKKEKKPPKKSQKNRTSSKRKKLCPCPEDQAPTNGFLPKSQEVNVLQTCPPSRNHRSRRNNRLSKRFSQNKHIKNMENQAFISYNKLRKNKDRINRRYKRDATTSSSHEPSEGEIPNRRSSMVLTSSCRLYMPNFEIRCMHDLYNDPYKWVKHMGHLARSVKTLQLKMKYMKTLRSCLNTYDEIMKSQTRMCECPPQPPKPKIPKPRMETRDNTSHPLADLNTQADRVFLEQKRIFEERKQQHRLIKETRQLKLNRLLERERKGKARVNQCGTKGLKCFILSNKTWATEPKWDGGTECYCTNSNNNTYWCVRIINEDTNVLYCQFITGFREYYDLNVDPYQLVSRELSLQEEQKNVYQDMIGSLRGCKGSRNCTLPHFHNPFPTTNYQVEIPDTESLSSEVDLREFGTDLDIPQGGSLASTDLLDDSDFLDDLDADEEEIDIADDNDDAQSSQRNGKSKGVRTKAKWRSRAGRGEDQFRTGRPKDRKKSKVNRRYHRKMRHGHQKMKNPKVESRPRGRGILDEDREGRGHQRHKKTRDQRKRGRTRLSKRLFRNKS